jgi:hypothetical protein
MFTQRKMPDEIMKKIMKSLFILILVVFGLLYSFYISLYAGVYTGLVFVLITIGFASTFYILDKNISYRIIFYIWIVIIVIATLVLILEWAFKITLLFKI